MTLTSGAIAFVIIRDPYCIGSDKITFYTVIRQSIRQSLAIWKRF